MPPRPRVRKALSNLMATAENPKQLMAQIGKLMVDLTKQRFATSTAPDGSRWAENSDITLLGYLDNLLRCTLSKKSAAARHFPRP